MTEKYVFGLGIGTAVWLSISLATTAVGLARAQQLAMGEWVLTCLAFWVLMSLVLAISLPLQLKFGAEKGRLVLLVAYGFLIGAGVADYYVGQMLGVQASQVTRWMESFGIGGMAAATILLVIAALALSYTISRKIVENKAF